MLGDDQNLWVVKFRNNPQHVRVLANELIATRMAESLGLAVPETAVVHVGQWLVESNPQLSIDHKSGHLESCTTGPQFGSRFVGGLMPQQVVDTLPEKQLQNTRNLKQFAGMLAFDKWTGNTDGRQAIFKRTSRERHYRAVFIDQGFCFNGGDWSFRVAPLQGVFGTNSVYSNITGWESFEPWLTAIENFSSETLWGITAGVPPEWYGNESLHMEQLINSLLRRKSRVRELIEQFRDTDRIPFPNWRRETCATRNASIYADVSLTLSEVYVESTLDQSEDEEPKRMLPAKLLYVGAILTLNQWLLRHSF
jgi:hypothetical protein